MCQSVHLPKPDSKAKKPRKKFMAMKEQTKGRALSTDQWLEFSLASGFPGVACFYDPSLSFGFSANRLSGRNGQKMNGYARLVTRSGRWTVVA